MLETTTPTTEDTGAVAEAAAVIAKVVTPRAPKVTLTHEGVAQPLLKYAFPAKAAKFPITVNGAVVDAATTEGRGKAYTYLLINNTSFYVPGVLPVDAACSVNFPDGYKFDEAQAVRVSTYKPKVKKAVEATPEGAAPAEAEASAVDGAGAVAVADDAAEAPKAARRAKK